jgi:hypothetical protein
MERSGVSPEVGLSTLSKQVKVISDEADPPDLDQNIVLETEPLRRGSRILMEERGPLRRRPILE